MHINLHNVNDIASCNRNNEPVAMSVVLETKHRATWTTRVEYVDNNESLPSETNLCATDS